MTPLEQVLRERIARAGAMPLNEYMGLALTHPEFGYYATRDPFGSRGDFITAPEISQAFGELIGLWLASQWITAGQPANAVLAEIGPGRGTLMADALRAAHAVPGLLDACKICLIEASPALRDIQRQALGTGIAHVDRLEDLPEGALFLVANEAFDALPILQYERRGKDWVEVRVGLVDDQLSFIGVRAPGDGLPDWPDGSVFETSPAALTQTAVLADRIARGGGAALIIDYGDRAPRKASLRAYRRHAEVHPLHMPGDADLTADVDFAALAATISKAGAQVHGPVPQASFLNAMGLATRTGALARTNPDKAGALTKARDRLVDPAEMGTAFKVLAITAPGIPVLPEFEVAP